MYCFSSPCNDQQEQQEEDVGENVVISCSFKDIVTVTSLQRRIDELEKIFNLQLADVKDIAAKLRRAAGVDEAAAKPAPVPVPSIGQRAPPLPAGWLQEEFAKVDALLAQVHTEHFVSSEKFAETVHELTLGVKYSAATVKREMEASLTRLSKKTASTSKAAAVKHSTLAVNDSTLEARLEASIAAASAQSKADLDVLAGKISMAAIDASLFTLKSMHSEMEEEHRAIAIQRFTQTRSQWDEKVQTLEQAAGRRSWV